MLKAIQILAVPHHYALHVEFPFHTRRLWDSVITMRSVALSFLAFVSYVSAAVLAPRATTAPTCVGLSAKSNDGNRKVAIVIDSSGSMTTSDPYDLRLAAGRALNNWLITKAEATGGRDRKSVV